jgi:hypothetical protein
METIALLIKLLIISLASLTVVHYSGIVGQIKMWLHIRYQTPLHQIKLKPIDCHICLSFWLSAVYFLVEIAETHPIHTADVLRVVVYGLATSTISHLIYKMFK